MDVTRDPYGPGGCGQVGVDWSSLDEFNVSEMGIKILEGEEEATCGVAWCAVGGSSPAGKRC